MKFIETIVAGAFVIEPDCIADARGFFARTYCENEFRERGLVHHFVQSSVSFNERRGTLRGMHFQADPYGEVKLVRCTRGAVYDVLVDLRPESATFKRWTAAELTEDNHRALYIPLGVAHGFQTLLDQSELCYQISQYYNAASSRGVRWNDPAFAIDWPSVDNQIMSDRDRTFPDYVA